MGRKLYLSLVILLFTAVATYAQTGEIKGKVTEAGGKEPIPFASVAALVNGNEVIATSTDFEGNFSLKPLNPGNYDVKITSVGYQSYMKNNVVVSIDKISFVNAELPKTSVELKEFIVEEYAIPLIDPTTARQATIDSKDIQAAPTRDVNSLVSTTAGIYQDKEGDLNVRGSREDATTYIVDGMKVRGTPSISSKGIEQITVITGGIPAQYGDVTGGVISVTTKGPSNEFGGGVELATSEFLDEFGYNLAAGSLTGPILSQKDSAGNRTGQSIIGFFIAGEYQYDKDPSPPSIPMYKVNDALLDDIKVHPLAPSPGGQGFINRADYLTANDLVSQKYRENVAQNATRINGKLDFRVAKSVDLTFGGSYENIKKRDFVDSYSLMNYDNNPERVVTKYNGFGRITQRFNSESTDKSSSVIKNAYYSVQVDYNYSKTLLQNATHKDNLFDYGYVGKFTRHYVPSYDSIFYGSLLNIDSIHFIQTATEDTFYQYVPGTQNPVTSNYTSHYYDLTSAYGVEGWTDNPSNVELKGGLLNQDNRIRLNTNGIWSLPGRVATSYSFAENTQGRLSAQGSADIKKHNIMVGVEYEQREDRGFGVNPNDLWQLMRLLGNQKQSGIDYNTAIDQYYSTSNIPVVHVTTYGASTYTPALNKDNEVIGSGFYENIRTQLGMNMSDTIQTDMLDPSTYSLGLFSPDELLNNGNPYITYYGYDYTGKEKTSGSWDLNDFFVNKDDDNNYFRKIDAYRPTYTAGYIQDRFTFNDIMFNIGVRVDRFDANQKVLKDPYLLYESYKAGDQKVQDQFGTEIPGNIGNDYVVYVDNAVSPTTPVGYRNGNIWYDRNGAVVTDLTTLTTNQGAAGIQPYLVNPEDYQRTRVNPNAFKDYEPQVNVMPRVAFSFPISDEAYFAAHYDVLTQRPQDNNLIRFDPIDYLNWAQGISANQANPALKPERTTEYEINFQQKLSRSSKFGISAFYKEMKDNIQIIALDYAYPIKYTAYGNMDFGTVKGLTFDYDLRRSANVRMTFSYTLQFADGTGSSETGQNGVISQQGQTNLREIKPLDFDQRHTIVVSFDYHYGQGKNYNGPVWFGKQFFANAGANFVVRAGSGTPYTRQSNITPTADFTTTANSRKVIAGTINGSRLPWSYRIDMKLDKSFDLVSGLDDKGNERRAISANLYLQVLNLLNTQNITSVYAATGSANDDGYIDSPEAQLAINGKVSPQGYIDLYRVAVNNPANYGAPRQIRLGLQINF